MPKFICYLFVSYFMLLLWGQANSLAPLEKNVVYVYNDRGVGKISLQQMLATLKQTLPSNYHITTINAEEIIHNIWTKDAALLVMPGGADIPYTEKLNGQGNQNIIQYVQNGGAYLGICAGAYYGSAYVEFDKDGPLEILGKRELAFFPGHAVGPILARYSPADISGIRAANISLHIGDTKENVFVYYNGGGYFAETENYKNVTILGYYDNHLPAIIYTAYGKGNVILSGVHFEYDPTTAPTYITYMQYLFGRENPLQEILFAISNTDALRKKLLQTILEKLGLEPIQISRLPDEICQ